MKGREGTGRRGRKPRDMCGLTRWRRRLSRALSVTAVRTDSTMGRTRALHARYVDFINFNCTFWLVHSFRVPFRHQTTYVPQFYEYFDRPTGGYVFTGVCLFKGSTPAHWSLVSVPFLGQRATLVSGPRSILGGRGRGYPNQVLSHH